MPKTLSEETPILLEKGDYRIEISPTEWTADTSGIGAAQVRLEKENMPTIYEDEASLPVNAVYGSRDKKAEFTYTSGEQGIKETITLNEKPETNVFEYKLDIGKLKARKNPTDEGIPRNYRSDDRMGRLRSGEGCICHKRHLYKHEFLFCKYRGHACRKEQHGDT